MVTEAEKPVASPWNICERAFLAVAGSSLAEGTHFCEHCQKKFHPRTTAQKYCSVQCQWESNNSRTVWKAAIVYESLKQVLEAHALCICSACGRGRENLKLVNEKTLRIPKGRGNV